MVLRCPSIGGVGDGFLVGIAIRRSMARRRVPHYPEVSFLWWVEGNGVCIKHFPVYKKKKKKFFV